ITWPNVCARFFAASRPNVEFSLVLVNACLASRGHAALPSLRISLPGLPPLVDRSLWPTEHPIMTQVYDSKDTLQGTPSASAVRPIEIVVGAEVPRTLSAAGRILPYLAIARPDHWFKNVFMALGVFLAYFYHPEVFGGGTLLAIAWAFLITCL